MVNVKPIRENGMILGKHINEARKAGESFDGSVKWDARGEEYVLNVISCDEEDFSKVDGFCNPTIVEYKVDETTYKKAKFGDWCRVKYVLRNGEKGLVPRAESLVLIENNK